MEIKKTKDYDGFEISAKRFYLPFVITAQCIRCEKEVTASLKEEYLSYPTLNEPIKRTIYCHDCDTETPFTLQLDVHVSFAQE